MATKYHYIFDYQGETGNEETGKHVASFTNVWVLDAKKEADKNGEWWSHYYPTHTMEDYTKKLLWEQFKAHALDHKKSAVILVKAKNQEDKIVTIHK